MKSLSFTELPDTNNFDVEKVEVPEFGVVEKSGEPFWVWVRPLTVAEFNDMIRRSIDFGKLGEDENGQVVVAFRDAFDESSLVAAWTAMDDDHNLVFGKNKEEAYQRVRSMHAKYRPAILRIKRKAMVLSTGHPNDMTPAENGAKVDVIEDAAKN